MTSPSVTGRWSYYHPLVDWYCRIHRYGRGEKCCNKAQDFKRGGILG